MNKLKKVDYHNIRGSNIKFEALILGSEIKIKKPRIFTAHSTDELNNYQTSSSNMSDGKPVTSDRTTFGATWGR